MEKLQYECEQYKVYAPDSLKYITDYLPEILIPKIEEYKELFCIKNVNQVQINYFDRLENFRNFVYEMRGERESLPEYSRGVGDEGMISAFIPKNAIVGTPLYQSSLYMANHELFHIWYNQYILKGDESKESFGMMREWQNSYRVKIIVY